MAVKDRPVVRISDPSAIHYGYVRVIRMCGNAITGTCPQLVTPCTVTRAEIAAGQGRLSPFPAPMGLWMNQVTDAAGPRFIGRLPTHILDIGR